MYMYKNFSSSKNSQILLEVSLIFFRSSFFQRSFHGTYETYDGKPACNTNAIQNTTIQNNTYQIKTPHTHI